MTNKTHSVLYVGVTSELLTRVYDHKNKKAPQCFTAKYNCNKLVYHFSYSTINETIGREKYLKGKGRQFKNNLINEFNPLWKDLYDELVIEWA
ncbi:GIY-YIG nuclease family protein [Mucilaginibacter mali]|nr:GIY-YIG nuclease family protein [Mucilaginibacter mali]